MIPNFTKKNKVNHSTKILLVGFLFLGILGISFGQDATLDSPKIGLVNKLFSLSTDSSNLAAPAFSSFELEVAAGVQYDTSYVGKKLRKRGQKLTVFGYYRLFGYGRNIIEPYPSLLPFEKTYGFGDGYREPTLSLSVFGRPNGKASFGTELFLFTPYIGLGSESNVFSTNLGINFYGQFRTKHGNFGVRAGGIHWYNLSDFTIGLYQVLDRFSTFDRTPWEGVTNQGKYENYFKTGRQSAGDLRWNNQAFQGLIINGSKLPGNLSFDLFWGKTQPNGGLVNGITDPALSFTPTLEAGSVPAYIGFAGESRFISNFITGGKIGRSFGKGKNTIFYNLLHSETALDSLNVDVREYQVHSLSYDLNFGKLKLKGELAAGYYDSPTVERKWGEALMVHAFIPKEYTFLPIDIQLYQIHQNFFNQNGGIATNSNPVIIKDFGLEAGTNGVGGQLTQVNQLVHNRRGININSGFEIKDFAFTGGWGISREIDPTATQISFIHRINGLALSRIFNPFPEGATSPTVFGPFGRKISFFRGVSEIVQTTDLDPATAEAINIKNFNSVDLQAKYKTEIGDRSLFIYYLASFASASTTVEPIPTFNDDSYLFVQYHEFDVYLELFPNFLLTGYLGLEDARGGPFTQTDVESQLPLDQFGTGIGLGFDWTVSKSTGLYFRHRWMNFEDRSFELDNYRGREVTLELKTFF